MRIRTKIAKLQMHKNVIENMFSFTFLCNFFMSFFKGQIKATNMLQLYTAYISYSFNPFRMGFQFFSATIFPSSVQMLFSQNSTGPWPQLQKGMKIPDTSSLYWSNPGNVHIIKKMLTKTYRIK